MNRITFVRGEPANLPQGRLYASNWLTLKGPGDIAYCPLPNRGDGWVLTRIAPSAAAATAPGACAESV